MTSFTAFTSYVQKLHSELRRTDHMYMVVVSAVIGLLGGMGAVGFRLLIRGLNTLAWGRGEYTLDYLRALPPLWKLLVPAAGGILVGLVTYHFAREAKGHGVPEVMEAVALKGGRIRPRVVLAKMLASGICIGSGGSVGREGPIVQIGSAIGSTVGQALRIDPARLRTLVGCGAAAGIAGTFNAPVAGALFAVEVILGDFGVAQFSPIVISSVAATVVSQHFLGDFPAFQVPPYTLVHASELFAYAAMGILAALVAVAFIRTLYRTEDIFEQLRIHPAGKALVGGLIIGLIGISFPEIFGVGYEAINEALNANAAWHFMLLLVVLKLLAVSVTIGSGGSGGIFAPSLFIGAMLGGAVGTVVHSTWPAGSATPGAYALVGMGGVVAATTHAPITAILIIFELTNDYAIILPLMISCIIATLVSTRIHSASIYTLKLLRRGVDLRGGKAVNVLEGIPVREVMRKNPLTVEERERLSNIISKLMDHPGATLFVVDTDGQLVGIVTPDELRSAMTNASDLASLVIAEDLMASGRYPRIRAADSLADAMHLLGSYRGEIPVVEDGRLAGVIWPEDVIARYNAEILKRDMASGMATAIRNEERLPEPISTGVDSVLAEVPAPAAFIGKTIKEVDVRRAFGVSILIVKQSAPDGGEHLETIATPDYLFRPGDLMLVIGSHDALTKLKAENI